MDKFSSSAIYKSTLVSQLNKKTFLSKDWLICVYNFLYFSNVDEYITTSSFISSMILGFGLDCGGFLVFFGMTTHNYPQLLL